MGQVDAETKFQIHRAFAEVNSEKDDSPAPPLTPEVIARDVRAAFQELDMRQLSVIRRLSPARRFGQICEMNEFLRRATLAAIRRQFPDIGDAALSRELLRRMGLPHVP